MSEKEMSICNCCRMYSSTVKERKLGPFVGPPDSYVTVYWCDSCWMDEGVEDNDAGKVPGKNEEELTDGIGY